MKVQGSGFRVQGSGFSIEPCVVSAMSALGITQTQSRCTRSIVHDDVADNINITEEVGVIRYGYGNYEEVRGRYKIYYEEVRGRYKIYYEEV